MTRFRQYRSGDYAAAAASLKKALSLEKETPEKWFFLAMANWQLGDKTQARKDYDQAIGSMKPSDAKDVELLRFKGEAAALLQGGDGTER